MAWHLFLFLAAVLLGQRVWAQCLSRSGTSVVGQLVATGGYALDDEGETPDLAFVGFSFPLGRASYSHFTVNANGELYLTDGTGTVGRASFGISSLAELRGVVGGSPRIAAMGGDNEGVLGLLSWDILVDTSIANEVAVTWLGMRTYGGASEFAMQVRLHASGEIEFSYDGDFAAQDFADYVGVSAGDGVGTGLESSSDLDAGGDTGAGALVFQNDWPPFDLDQKTVRLSPNPNGGFRFDVVCAFGNPPAAHRSLGSGCYDLSTYASVYQRFGNSAAAEVALEGTALRFVPDGLSGLVLLPSQATLRGTQLAVPLALGDDEVALVRPSIAFRHLGLRPYAELFVSSNGFVAVGAVTGAFQGTSIAGFRRAPTPMFVAYGEDLDPSLPGPGSFYVEEHNAVLYITVDRVQHVAGRGTQTHQYQFDLLTGEVVIVYGDVGHLDQDEVLVGYAPGGLVVDMGGIDLAADLPFAVSVDWLFGPLTLSASPSPRSTPVMGTTVHYAIENVPQHGGIGSGPFVGLLAISSALRSPALDLRAIGAPGCAVHLATLDQLRADAMQFSAARQFVPVAIPAGVPPGVRFYAQALALVAPGSLPNGRNGLGLLTSNAIESVVSRHDD